MLVSRPSHSHQVPQAGRPQIEPVARQIAANTAPGTAAALAAMPAKGCRQTSSVKLAAAMAIQPAMPSQAAGTWMNRMRTVSPCSRSGGTLPQPHGERNAGQHQPRQQQQRRQPAGDAQEAGGIGIGVHGGSMPPLRGFCQCFGECANANRLKCEPPQPQTPAILSLSKDRSFFRQSRGSQEEKDSPSTSSGIAVIEVGVIYIWKDTL